MSETAYAIQRNSDRMYLEHWPLSVPACEAFVGASWCEDEADALTFPSMTHATTEALMHMPAGADWIVVPISEKETHER